MTDNKRKSECDRCAGNNGTDPVCKSKRNKKTKCKDEIAVDLPETMKIRSQFLTETGPVYQIAKSAMDDSYIDDIDYHGKNILVIIEGLTMYLYEKDIRKMMCCGIL